MNRAGVNFVKFHPEQFFAFLKENNYPVYHRSPIFFRDFQYGLWRFLQESQTKVAYAEAERMARDVIEDFEARGLVRKISRQNYELQMPDFTTVWPTDDAKVAPAATQAKPVAAAKAPAAKAPAVAVATAQEAAAVAAEPVAAAPVAAPVAAGDKESQVAALKAKMAEARQRLLDGVTERYWKGPGG